MVELLLALAEELEVLEEPAELEVLVGDAAFGEKLLFPVPNPIFTA